MTNNFIFRFLLSNGFLSALSSPLLSVAESREVSRPSFARVGDVFGRVLPWRLVKGNPNNVPTTCNKSKVWQHFGFTKKDGKFDKTHAICKICRAAIKYTGSTTNLGTHLKRRHGDTSASSSNSAMATVASSTSTPSKQTEQSIATNAPPATNSARSKAKTLFVKISSLTVL